MKQAYDYKIIGHKNGMKKEYRHVTGRKTMNEEVKRLNNIDDGVKYEGVKL